MSYLYQIYCNTEDAYVSAWSNVPLTTCPNNAGHSVNLDSVYVDQAARASTVVCIDQTLLSLVYATVGAFFYQGTDYFSIDKAPIKYLKVNAFVSLGNYNIRLVDSSNNVIYESSALSNTSPSSLVIDFDLLSLPASEDVFRLQVKTSAGTVVVLVAETYSALSLDS